MKNQNTIENYFVMEPGSLSGCMLLVPLRDVPEEQGYTMGQAFNPKPEEPVLVKVRDGYEEERPPTFMSVPPVMSNELYEVFKECGVKDIEFYDAMLVTAKGGRDLSISCKVFNVTRLTFAADLATSTFAEGMPSRTLDASFDSLSLDESKMNGILVTRLGEFTSAVIVHHTVKEAIEKAGIEGVRFIKPKDYIS